MFRMLRRRRKLLRVIVEVDNIVVFKQGTKAGNGGGAPGPPGEPVSCMLNILFIL